MATPLLPQEIWFLEVFSSSAYFKQVRDAWRTMLDDLEAAMDRQMRGLPADYRSRPMSEQPDIGWGQRVIPNFRDTMQDLDSALIRMRSGELLAMKLGGGPASDQVGQIRDYPAYWLTDEEARHFNRWMSEAASPSEAIRTTINGGWEPGDLVEISNLEGYYKLKLPTSWPLYRLNPKVRVASGEMVSLTGIYLPDADGSCPQLFVAGDEWPVDDAQIGIDNYGHHTSEVPTVWTLVERIADNGGGIPGETDPIKAGVRLRCDANQACPLTGHWFTPAVVNSRRYFTQGDVMPDFKSDYGLTIWQWDEQQS